MDGNSEFPFQSNFEIPFDLFVRKKSEGLGTPGTLKFTDSKGHLVYRVQHPIDNSTNWNSTRCTKLLLDASGDTLFSVNRVNKGSWKGFRGNVKSGDTGFIFKVNRTLDEFSRKEFDIVLVGDHSESSKTEMKMKGCPFKRSCTIYKGDSIVAETSLMYKLGIGKAFVPRNRFRVTIFPGFADHGLIVSLVTIFFDGRKIWI
ncbi:protein LURP-one-related 7 [Primulina tabacum]|uniref:protein LURP-one-related 7 n=1 Tax=Primulina tabacum TaxID=48773 RepID=UPI003F5A13F4